MRTFFLVLVVLIMVAGAAVASGQATQTPSGSSQSDPGITPNGAIGEVKLVDAAGGQLIIKTDAGSVINVAVTDKTIYMRTAPGEKTLTNATRITLADLAEGDRVWARGKVLGNHKSVPALAIVVMTKADIARKHEQERTEWRRRGILGIISALKPDTKEITISTRSMMGSQAVIIPVSEKVELRRYAPDSIKFSDAKSSAFEELRVGDQLRALGERSADGTHFAAEKIVTGSFRTVAGVVTAVDLANSEIRVNDLDSKQPFAVVVKGDAVVREFPSEMGGMMARNGPGRGDATSGSAPGDEGPRPTPNPSGGTAMRMGGGGGIQEMLERLPSVSITEVKVGDTILVSSTKGADPSRLTAITLVTRADRLLSMLAARQQLQTGAQPNPAAGLGTGITFGIGLP